MLSVFLEDDRQNTHTFSPVPPHGRLVRGREDRSRSIWWDALVYIEGRGKNLENEVRVKGKEQPTSCPTPAPFHGAPSSEHAGPKRRVREIDSAPTEHDCRDNLLDGA